MLTFNDAQLAAWLSPIIWPFLRILALFSGLPVLGQRGVPARVRVALAFLITLCAQASLPAMPVIALDSPIAFVCRGAATGTDRSVPGLCHAHRLHRGGTGG